MIISIKVFPNSKKSEIKKIGDRYEVRLDAPAEKGRANTRLIEILGDYFNVAKSKISIIHGHNSRNKIIDIATL